MWILAIPVGAFSLWGAYLAFKKLVGWRVPPKFAYLLVLSSTAFMVVPWLLPGGIFKLIMVATFILYLWLGASAAWDWITRKNRGTTVNVTAQSIEESAREALTESLLSVIALAASRDSDFYFEIGGILRNDPAFAGLNYGDLDKRYERLQALAAYPEGFDEVFSKAKGERNKQQLNQFAERIRSNLNGSAQSVIDEATR
jgi:hypothetical protein